MGSIIVGIIFLLCVTIIPVLIPIVIILTVALVIFASVSEKKNKENANEVEKAELINITPVYKRVAEHTGYSFSWSGHCRDYYRYRNVLDHYECVFSVVYKDGRTGTIKCRKDSDVYNILIWKTHN